MSNTVRYGSVKECQQKDYGCDPIGARGSGCCKSILRSGRGSRKCDSPGESKSSFSRGEGSFFDICSNNNYFLTCDSGGRSESVISKIDESSLEISSSTLVSSSKTTSKSSSSECKSSTSGLKGPPSNQQIKKAKSKSGLSSDENRLIMKYSPFVLLGNWAEELYLKEEAMKMFLLRRSRNELTIQSSRAMFTNLLKDAVVTAPGVSVKYGDTIQITCPDVSSYDNSSKGLCLSGVISVLEVDRTRTLVEGCQITASAFLGPCSRNVFRIISLTPNKNRGDPVGYGDTVAFQLSETCSDLELFIECEFPNINLVGDTPYGALKLSSTITRYSRFKPYHLDPRIRDLVLGEPVPPNVKILISSASTHRNICADTNYWMNTYFGPECRAICQTLLDVNKNILPENQWMFEARVQAHPFKPEASVAEQRRDIGDLRAEESQKTGIKEVAPVETHPEDNTCSGRPWCASCTLPTAEPPVKQYEEIEKNTSRPGFTPQSSAKGPERVYNPALPPVSGQRQGCNVSG